MPSKKSFEFITLVGSKKFNIVSAITVITLAALAGYFILATRASGIFVASEAENSTLSGNVSPVTDAAASNGQALKFGLAAGMSVRVSGNHLVDASNNTLVLRGANVSVTETACAQNWTDDPYGGDPLGLLSTYQAMATWHINVLRVPMNEDCWLALNGARASGANYQNAIKQEVALAHQAGLYVILDLHWSAPGSQIAVGQNYAPDADHSVTFWQQVAAAFKNDPAVIFDLYNEPIYDWISSDPWNCYLNGCTASRYYSQTGVDVQGSWQVAGFNQLITAIRNTGATQPVLANGLLWGNDDTQWLAHHPTDPLSQLIAGAHIYPGQNDGLSSTVTSARPAQWSQVYGPIAAQYPILIGEIGDHTSAPVAFLPTFLPYAASNGWSYLAWTWNNWGDPDNVLLAKINNNNNDYLTPTPNSGEGSCFKSWLLNGACP